MKAKTTKILGYKNIAGQQIPIVACERRKDIIDGLMFYCDQCKKWHYHGSSEGHRSPHCDHPSRFIPHGYILQLETGGG